MEPVIILFWWVLFGGSHLILSSQKVRPKLIQRLGEWPFRGLYSLVAFVTLVPLIVYFSRHKHAEPLFWSSHVITHDLSVILMALAFVLLAVGLVARPPSSMVGGRKPEAYGVTCITRHPTFAAFFIFGLAHCLVNGSAGDLIFFGGFVVFACLGAWHQDTRKVVEVPEYAEFKAATSFLPFGAIIKKRQSLALKEMNWIAGIVGFALFYVLRIYHSSWFGGTF
jgi:uncharacterized membrane protein